MKSRKLFKTSSVMGALFFSLLMGLTLATGSAYAKSLYVLASHHAKQFDAWNINPDGTFAKQGTYTLLYARYPAGVAIHEPSKTLFISSESYDLEVVDATTFNSLGELYGVQFAGIAVDDKNDILYAIGRWPNLLYAYDFSRTGSTWTLTLKTGFPKALPGLYNSYGMGIALDELSDPPVLWVTDSGNMMVRAYDTSTWLEDTTLSFSTASTGRGAIGIGMDRRRGILYWGSMSWGAGIPPNAGSFDLYKYDLSTATLTSQYIGHDLQVVDVSVDEDTGLVYITETYQMSAWDTTTSPWTMLQRHSFGAGAATTGIAVTNVSFMPDLAVEKVDDVADDGCLGVHGDIEYTVSYENTGETDLTGVTIVDDLPVYVDFVSASDGGIYNGTDRTVTWDIGDVAQGGLSSVSLDGQVNSAAVLGSTIINYATIDSNETAVTTVQESTDICTNQPPVADADGPYGEECTSPNGASVQFDGSGSYDPDGDSLTYDWLLADGATATGISPWVQVPLGSQGVTLTVTDPFGESDEDSTMVTVADTTPPVIKCNNPPTIVPPDAPIAFTATVEDACTAADSTVQISGYDCWFINGAGKRVDKTQSCVVSINDDTITVVDSGGVGDNIEWTVEATDGAGNTTMETCSLTVLNPEK